MVRLTDHPDMTLDVYCGRKTIQQQQQATAKGWMNDLPFYVILILFQTYQDDGSVIMKGCVQLNLV